MRSRARYRSVGQLPQTSYRSLLTPYSYFGLGRTNNYVESLFVGSTRRQREHYLAMEGVIPNSQVVIIPWQGGDKQGAENGKRGDPATWQKELYLHPGEWIPWVTVVLVTAIVMLAGLVFVLHLNERVSKCQLPDHYTSPIERAQSERCADTPSSGSLSTPFPSTQTQREDERERKRAVHAINFDAL